MEHVLCCAALEGFFWWSVWSSLFREPGKFLIISRIGPARVFPGLSLTPAREEMHLRTPCDHGSVGLKLIRIYKSYSRRRRVYTLCKLAQRCLLLFYTRTSSLPTKTPQWLIRGRVSNTQPSAYCQEIMRPTPRRMATTMPSRPPLK